MKTQTYLFQQSTADVEIVVLVVVVGAAAAVVAARRGDLIEISMRFRRDFDFR